MDKKLEVNIMVSKFECREQSVIRTRKCRMREWLIRRFFADPSVCKMLIRDYNANRFFRENYKGFYVSIHCTLRATT